MNAVHPLNTLRRRRLWPWVLGVCLAPYLLLGIAAWSYLGLDRDAARLRNVMMSASDVTWRKTVQMSVGNLTLSAVRSGLAFATNPEVADAARALEAISQASVGVYESASDVTDNFSVDFMAKADKAMNGHGWKRLVAVTNEREKVLIYISPKPQPDEPVELCLAVLDGKQLVVVSTRIHFDRLAEFIELRKGEGWMKKLHLAKL